MLTTIHTWLTGFPGLEGLTPERLDPAPGSAGLFCKGLQILSRQGDILGGESCRCRLSLELTLHASGTQVPQALLDLADAAIPLAPILGQHQTVAIEKGRLVQSGPGGISRWAATITFEYTSEVYYGEN